MKRIEEILADLNEDNLVEEIAHLNGQIEYNANRVREVAGISLMTVRALLPRFTDQMLRNNGYILTIDQLIEDGNRFLELKAKDPLVYNSRLKRWHNSFTNLVNQYTNNNIHNDDLQREVQSIFSEALFSCYTAAATGKKMPNDLSTRIHSMIEAEIVKLNQAWFNNALPKDISDEFTLLLETQLLSFWQHGNLPVAITRCLEEEKKLVNSVESLVAYFHDKKLARVVENQIREEIIKKLTAEAGSERISVNSHLGSTINNLINNSIKRDNVTIYSQLLEKWQNGELTAQAAEQLTKIIASVIATLRVDLERDLTEQFDQLAVHIFLEKLQKSAYPKIVLDAIQEYALGLGKSTLSIVSTTDNDGLHKSKEALVQEVMLQLHDQWMHGRLVKAECDFIQDLVFGDLKDLDERIQKHVWSNESSHVLQLEQTVEQLQQKVDQFEQVTAELKAMLQQVMAQKTQQAAPAPAPAEVEEAKVPAKSGYGFFGSK